MIDRTVTSESRTSQCLPIESGGSEPGGPPTAPPRRLLDQVRDAIRLKHYSWKTEKAYVLWVRQFILFHGKRHPAEMGPAEVRGFLTHLAVKRHVAISPPHGGFF